MIGQSVCVIVALLAAGAASVGSQQQAVRSILAGTAPADADAAFVEGVRCVGQAGGRFEYDRQGRLIGVDLLSGRVSVGDAQVRRLAGLAGLRKLKLSGSGITKASIPSLLAMKDLADLSLQDTLIDNASVERLTALGKLKSLNLRASSKLTDEALESLGKLPGLTGLGLGDNAFTDRGLKSLRRLERLRMLDLRGCSQITDAGLAQLRQFKRLAVLRLSGDRITDAGMDTVKSLTHLTGLDIESCGVTSAGLAKIGKLPIEDLTLFRCYSINDEGLRCLAGFGGLKQLSLRDIPINGSGLAHLPATAKAALRTLTLAETGVDDNALKHLEGCTALARLDLSSSRITDAGLRSVATLANLESLDLESAGVSDVGIAHLAKLEKLESLNLQGNSDVTDASVAALGLAEPQIALHHPDGHP